MILTLHNDKSVQLYVHNFDENGIVGVAGGKEQYFPWTSVSSATIGDPTY